MAAIWLGPPRSYTKGRPRPIQYVVIHATAGSEGTRSAEAGAAYDKTRTDGTSTHVFADSDSLVREVWDVDQAHAARQHGNAIGLQLEICGSANQTAAQWADALSAPTLVLAARQVAEWCALYSIPVRRLTVAQTRAAWYAAAGQRPRGIVGHNDITAAYPEDQGTHYDPGPGFPWQGFLQMVAAELAGGPTGGDDLTPNQGTVLDAIFNLSDTVKLDTGSGLTTFPVPLTKFLKELDSKVAVPTPVTVDASAVAAALATDTTFLAALAKAVNDDAAERLQS